MLSGGPSGPGGLFSPGPGNAVAGGIATGIGMAVVGVGVGRTADACLQPDASATCLRGPGPHDQGGEAEDAGPP